MKLLWDERGWSDYLSWQDDDKKTLRKVNALLKDIQRNPYEGIGKPEPLKEICPAGGAGESTQLTA